ncbi:MAG: hypothetical protein P1U85_16315 [Verrucomicrobiales bacterium]|nr:hypothetical protein [Verrucomicrobiales bacterium]
MASFSSLISSIPDLDSLYFVLFAGFAIALIIWIILWMLGADDSRAEDESEETSSESVNEKPEPEPEPAKTAVPSATTTEGEDEIDTATEEEAASLFADELASGDVKQDPVYGIVYTQAPQEIDDLKKIKGVAKVLEGKLHGIGVYRFKQVAVWTDAACAEFSKLLTFKNRIYRDNWIAQAKEFHQEKYDEEL